MIRLIKKLSLFLVITLIINSFIVIKSEADVKEGAQELTNIIVFINFSDSEGNFMENRRNTIIEMYNGTSIKSLSNYISTISNEKVKVNNYFPQDNNSVIIPYTLSQPRSYYNSSKEYEMIKEIISHISVDTSINLDRNNDGQVDNVTFVFQGSSSSMDDVFWPHKSNHNNGSSINGKAVNTYNVHNEKSIFQEVVSGQKGVIAHEFLHSLGLPDLYRGSGSGKPVGEWDIMALNSVFLQYPLAYLRKDWVGIDTINKSGTYTLEPVSSNPDNQAFIIKTPLSEKEFFMVEYRKQGNPYKDELEGRIPGSGLIIYRVNTSEYTNFSGDKDFLYIFRPGETGEGDAAGNIREAFLSEESGRTSYGTSDMNAKITDGAITYSSGLNSGIVIKNVSSAGDSISFDVELPDLSNDGVWNLVGNGTVNSGDSDEFSMDVVGNEIYITYSEGDFNKDLKAIKYDGANWVSLGNSIAKVTDKSKIKVYNGVPYVLYNDYDYKLNISKFENGNWTKLQTITSDIAQYSDMIATENGLYIAYTDPYQDILKVAKFNTVTNKFENIGSDIDRGYIYGLSITENNGEVYVSYSNFYSSDKIKVKKYSNGSWADVGNLDIIAKNTNIIAQDGKIYLAVATPSIRVYELKDNNWIKLGNDLASKEGNYPKLQMSNKNLYVSYIDTETEEIKLKVFDGTDWVQDGYRVSDKPIINLNFDVVNGVGYIGYIDTDGLIEVKNRTLNKVTSEYEAEDVDKNGTVDILDLSKVALKYNVDSNSDSFEEDLDINKDNIIDIFDLVLISKKIE
ncbi:M6 family metalloprotease domain-containing protein [Clostridium sp. Sa3CUN1]|uniref:M6 family metalloprotease domain-containing protein n=1 Tax=Clostridium gallinarum TaxID=2762246 RepID=A0ABR8Q5E6_9CLOT|nr:M6 family metalloprotease domain-containing protein [Clostridium gallinarum]MBD7915641.1 M6 family metalloprotease domain-containing protein [Clostridium gallinarum]